MQTVRAAMIGDVVGSSGLEALEAQLPALIKEHNLDFVTVNGENAAEGFGMTESDFMRIIAAGADVVTSGNHIWEKREFWTVLNNKKNMLRPANYPCLVSGAGASAAAGAPGAGSFSIQKNGVTWTVINLQGREFMSAIDCPFQCLDRILSMQAEDQKTPVVIVDFHAESSREKEALGYYADGRVSLIAGTHTHVQTADERILPKGSAYITDLGMTGIHDSVIGMDPKICLDRVRKQVMYHMETADAKKPGRLQGVIAEIDIETGMAAGIWRV